MLHKLLQENGLCHYIGCSLEAFLPSHLQKTQECRAIDGLSPSLASACGHMRPPSKGWPSNLPAYWGSALIVASAAPVDVGTRLAAPARPRRTSFFGPSTNPWVEV